MHTKLVCTATTDGLRLDGAFNSAAAGGHHSVDALICLHGVASTFYGSSLFESLTGPLLAAGVAVLRANTRGHDNVYPSTGGRRFGAAYERVEQCTLDIDAWWNCLRERGHDRIGLLGHSLGAIKGVFHQSQQGCEQAACLLALSPPRLSHLAFSNGAASAVYSANLAEARKRVDAGDGSQLMEATFPFPLLITAAGYLDKYGPGERYNVTDLVSAVQCRTLFTYGQRELDGPAFAGVPDAIRQRADASLVDLEVIEDADHLYTGVHDKLAEQIVHWLSKHEEMGKQ